VPVVPPLAIDQRRVHAIVEVEGEPLTVVQARRPDVKLSLAEREALRGGLVTRQAGLQRELEGLGAEVVRGYQNSYNGLSVLAKRADLQRIARLPGVLAVHPLRPIWRSNESPGALVGVPPVWSGTPKGLHGESIKVAIIDGGIDYTHANFRGPGTPEAYAAAHASEADPADPKLFGPHAPRIKGGTDLVGDAYDPSSDDPEIASPHPDDNPLDCDGHGSHVAGIVGGSGVTPAGAPYTGPYDAETGDQPFRVPPGIAPRVDLYAVRVFGCEGPTLEAIDGIEWAVDHDMDVMNLSFGGDVAGADDPNAVAAANAVKAGVVVVAAAGNAGGAPYLAGSPANGAGVVSVGALDGTETLPGATLDLGGASVAVENIDAATFADGTAFRFVVLGTPDALSTGCHAADYDRPDVAGALVLELRGDCDFSDRVTLAQLAGAAGILLVNNADGYPPFIGAVPGFEFPLFGVAPADVAAFGAGGTAVATNTLLANPNYGAVAEFSSSGPRIDDSALEPSVVAPGVAVVSTAIGTGADGIAFSGTSMATPVVSGLAALSRQAHPSWRATDIGKLLANTADPSRVTDYAARRAGAGVPQALGAVQSSVVADSGGAPALNFGFVELGSDTFASGSVSVRNFSAAPARFAVSAPDAEARGFAHALTLPSTLVVPPFGRASFDVRVDMAADPAADPLAFTDFAGSIVLTPRRGTNAGVAVTLPYYGVVRPEAELAATAALPSPRRPSGSLRLKNTGGVLPGSAEVFAWGIESAEDATGCHDVRAAGVESLPYDGDRLLVFALNVWQRCSLASVNEWDVNVTLDNGDAFLVAGIDAGLVENGAFSGELGTLIVNLQTNETTLMPAFAATDSGVVYLTALASELGLSARAPRFGYTVAVTNLFDPSAFDAPDGTATFDAFEPALLGVGARTVVAADGGTRLGIGIRPREWARTPAKGFMLVFAENAPGPEQAALFGLGASNAE
jgi:subtilisin family serine protease